jgi:hypothetical protein
MARFLTHRILGSYRIKGKFHSKFEILFTRERKEGYLATLASLLLVHTEGRRRARHVSCIYFFIVTAELALRLGEVSGHVGEGATSYEDPGVAGGGASFGFNGGHLELESPLAVLGSYYLL